MLSATEVAVGKRASGAPQLLVLTTTLLTVTGLMWSLDGWRPQALLVVGALLGFVLYQSAFGFSAAYRRLFLFGDTALIRAQLVMLAGATLVFAPMLASGTVFGRPVIGAVAPAGLQVALGAFTFGIGMQLAGGCGSGTLFTLGGGSLRMIVTLAFFCAGSFAASLDMPFWQSVPSAGPLSLSGMIGWPGAVAVQLSFLALLGLACMGWSARQHTPVQATHWGWRGPWPVLAGALLLAVLNAATLVLAGHPWTITWAFTLWGAKTAVQFGWDPSLHPFWRAPFQARALEGSVLSDITSLMDVGLVLGALAAAALAGRFAPSLRLTVGPLLGAVLGGLLMGYGSRISFGCNIGAFFSGIASTSLHGWLWIACALPGNWVGVQLRPLFRLSQ